MPDVMLGFDPGSVPYHAGGPIHISPFLLSVICFLAAERNPDLQALIHPLRTEIYQLLAHSPTESFLGSVDLETFRPAGESEHRWEPELGIGPEEAVAAAFLALFTHDRIWTSAVSKLARRWAGGLMDWWDSDESNERTFGETIGLFPAPRQLRHLDKARFWLIVYIARALADLQSAFPSATMPTPEGFCEQILLEPERTTGDLLLTRHARGLKALNQWYRAWDTCSDSITDRMRVHREANANFDKWRMDNDMVFHGETLSKTPRALLDIVYAFAKSLTHAAFARWVMTDGVVTKVDRQQYRDAMWAGAVDASMELVNSFAGITSGQEMRSLPATFYILLNQAVEIIMEAKRHSAAFWLNSSVLMAARRLTAVANRLNKIASSLEEVPMPPEHGVSKTAASLRDACAILGARASATPAGTST